MLKKIANSIVLFIYIFLTRLDKFPKANIFKNPFYNDNQLEKFNITKKTPK